MASINKVIIVGNLGRDPETRYTTGGEAICNIAVATSDRWKDKATGEQREATEWHRISAFGKLAEIMGQYLKKGSQVYIEGKIRTRKYTDKDGIDIVVEALESIFIAGDEGRSIQNKTQYPASMMVILGTPKA